MSGARQVRPRHEGPVPWGRGALQRAAGRDGEGQPRPPVGGPVSQLDERLAQDVVLLHGQALRGEGLRKPDGAAHRPGHVCGHGPSQLRRDAGSGHLLRRHEEALLPRQGGMTRSWKPKSEPVRSHPHTSSVGGIRPAWVFWEDGVPRPHGRDSRRTEAPGVGGRRPGESGAHALGLPVLQGVRHGSRVLGLLLPTCHLPLLLLLQDHFPQLLPLPQLLRVHLRCSARTALCVGDSRGRCRSRKLGDAGKLRALRVPRGAGRSTEVPLGPGPRLVSSIRSNWACPKSVSLRPWGHGGLVIGIPSSRRGDSAEGVCQACPGRPGGLGTGIRGPPHRAH